MFKEILLRVVLKIVHIFLHEYKHEHPEVSDGVVLRKTRKGSSESNDSASDQ